MTQTSLSGHLAQLRMSQLMGSPALRWTFSIEPKGRLERLGSFYRFFYRFLSKEKFRLLREPNKELCFFVFFLNQLYTGKKKNI